MNLTIRQAIPGDLAALLRFQQCVVEAERAFDPTIKDGPVLYYDIAALISSPDVHFLVAECGSDPVGCGYARIEAAKHYLRHRVHAYLGLMYVDPAHRGQSVNAKIITRSKRGAARGRSPNFVWKSIAAIKRQSVPIKRPASRSTCSKCGLA